MKRRIKKSHRRNTISMTLGTEQKAMLISETANEMHVMAQSETRSVQTCLKPGLLGSADLLIAYQQNKSTAELYIKEGLLGKGGLLNKIFYIN